MSFSLRNSILSVALAAAILAGTATFLDWSANPGGVFRSTDGTAWGPVFDTFWSWWWPLCLAGILLSVAKGWILGQWRPRRR